MAYQNWNGIEGNARIFESFLDQSKAKVFLNTPIEAIQFKQVNTTVQYTLFSGSKTFSEFDAVVIALPLSVWSDIQLPITEDQQRLIKSIQYHTMYVTYVQGHLNETIFPGSPTTVVSIKNTSDPLISISLVSTWESMRLYKVFSIQSLSSNQLSTYFSTIDAVRTRTWQAYPIMNPIHSPLPPVQLTHGLYYLNGMESVLSTMETQTLSSLNLIRMWKSQGI